MHNGSVTSVGNHEATVMEPIPLEYSETTNPVASERDLWAAVVMRAIGDLDSRSKSIRREAREWIDSNNTSPGSFLWVCTALGLPPYLVRRRIDNAS